MSRTSFVCVFESVIPHVTDSLADTSKYNKTIKFFKLSIYYLLKAVMLLIKFSGTNITHQSHRYSGSMNKHVPRNPSISNSHL